MRLATTTGDFSAVTPSHFERIDHLCDAGFRYIDLSLYRAADIDYFMGEDWREKAEELKIYAASKGMTFVQAHSPGGNPFADGAQRLIETTKRSIEVVGYLGIPNTVVHTGMKPGLDRQGYYDESLRFLSQLFPEMEANHVNVLIENSAHVNMGGNYFFYDGEDMKNFLAFAGHPLLHACWDTGHANIEGHQREDILALGDDLRAVHINDNRGERDEHVLPFIGTASFDEVLSALIEIGFPGPFTLECESTLIRPHGWPFGRGEYAPSKKLLKAPTFAYDALEKLLFELGKYMLTSYGVYEA